LCAGAAIGLSQCKPGTAYEASIAKTIDTTATAVATAVVDVTVACTIEGQGSASASAAGKASAKASASAKAIVEGWASVKECNGCTTAAEFFATATEKVFVSAVAENEATVWCCCKVDWLTVLVLSPSILRSAYNRAPPLHVSSILFVGTDPGQF
jgi:hypothetical protein